MPLRAPLIGFRGAAHRKPLGIQPIAGTLESANPGELARESSAAFELAEQAHIHVRRPQLATGRDLLAVKVAPRGRDQVEILGGKILCLGHLEAGVAGIATLARIGPGCSIDGS